MPTCDLASIVSQPLRTNHPPISELLWITNLWENVKNFGQPVYPPHLPLPGVLTTLAIYQATVTVQLGKLFF